MIFSYIFLFFFLLLVFVACWERRLIWPYGIPEPGPRFGDPKGYGFQKVMEATQNQFVCFGWSPDVKGPRYQVSYAMLISPDRNYFVIVGTGTVVGFSATATCLYSRGQDDRLYFTTDHQNSAEIDISGLQKCQLALEGSFVGLWRRHVEWLQRDGIVIQPFDVGAEVDCFHRLRAMRCTQMLDRGLIGFADPSNIWWTYRLIGAVRYATTAIVVGFVRAVTLGRLPRSI